MTLIKTVYEIGKIAFRYGKSAGKFTSGQSTFIRHFPPAHRRTVGTILKGFSTVTTGGIISDVIKDYMSADDTPGNGSPIPFNGSSTNKQNKTRGRFATRSRRKYSGYCKPDTSRRFAYSNKRFRSSYR